MKSIQKFLILSFISISLLACKSFQVVPISSKLQNEVEEGIMYNLPMTKILVDVKVKESKYQAGPFSKYSEQFFGKSIKAEMDSTKYEILDVSISSVSLADPNQQFWIELGDDNLRKNQELQVGLCPDGILKWLKIVDVKKGSSQKKKKTNKIIEKDIVKRFDHSQIKKNKVKAIKEEILYTAIDEENAQSLFDELTEIQKQKKLLITGFQEVNYEANAIRFMYAQLDAREKSIMRLFTGSSSSQVHDYQYSYIPGSKQLEASSIISRFSDVEGILGVSETGSAPVILSFTTIAKEQELENWLNTIDGEDDQHGIHYRIPGKAHFSISLANKILAEETFTVCQIGLVAKLPEKALEVKLDQETGALIYVKYAP